MIRCKLPESREHKFCEVSIDFPGFIRHQHNIYFIYSSFFFFFNSFDYFLRLANKTAARIASGVTKHFLQALNGLRGRDEFGGISRFQVDRICLREQCIDPKYSQSALESNLLVRQLFSKFRRKSVVL